MGIKIGEILNTKFFADYQLIAGKGSYFMNSLANCIKQCCCTSVLAKRGWIPDSRSHLKPWRFEKMKKVGLQN